jgi:hypothetical protein
MKLEDNIYYIPRWELIPGNENPSDEELKNRANEILEQIELLQDRVAAFALVLGPRPKDAVKQGYRFY